MLERITAREWNHRTAAHLLGRAGFGGTPDQIDEFARLTPGEAVARVTSFAPRPLVAPAPAWAVPDDELSARALRKRAGHADLPGPDKYMYNQRMLGRAHTWRVRLGEWWLEWMRESPAPLQEKMTLFWHGHFATQISVVKSGWAMYLQNRLFREHAVGSFRDLLAGVCRDPAMLRYLDNARSRKENPNENFARELLELFTVGIGNYDEGDVRETARAFTGWTLHPDRVGFAFREDWHDFGPKVILGHRGNHDGEDVVDMLVAHPACRRRLARKLWRFFASDEPDDEAIEAMAETLRTGGMEILPVLETLFTSRAFYSEAVRGAQVKSPARWLIGLLDFLETPPPSTTWVRETMMILGQELFEPPNVAGWPGGSDWITTSTLVSRYRIASELIGRLRSRRHGSGFPAPPAGTSGEEALELLAERLFGGPIAPAEMDRIRPALEGVGVDASRWSEEERGRVVARLVATTLYQLS